MSTVTLDDFRRDEQAQGRSPEDIEAMVLLWQHKATREEALSLADKNRALSINKKAEKK